MNWKRLIPWMAASLFCLVLGARPASAQCKITWNSPFTGPIDLNAEGLVERSADVVISSASAVAQTCFVTGNDVAVQWNAWMTLPVVSSAIPSAGTPISTNYFTIHDASDTLGIDVTGFAVNVATGLATDIEINVETGTLDVGATVVLKNLRFDLTGTVLAGSQKVPDGTALDATLSWTVPPGTYANLNVGNSKRTVNTRRHAVDTEGFGYADGVCPFAAPICVYPNVGGETNALVLQSFWDFDTNPAWVTDFPFRRVGENFGVAGDIPIGETDLVLDVENIPSGVTVTFPNQLNVCHTIGHPYVTWTTAGTPSTTGGSLQATYQTTSPVPVGSVPPVLDLAVVTAKTADNGCDAGSFLSEIGVQINDPSGTGTANLRVVMGPSPAGQFSGDDVSNVAVPRYITDITNSAPSREIIGDSSVGGPIPYFVVNPTQTVLLYPYVTNFFGYETGIEVGNTGNDSTVFGNTGQKGALNFYFFPSIDSTCTGCVVGGVGVPFTYTVAAGVGRGLDAAGLLEPGGDFADTLTDLITKAGHAGTFEGYLILVANFNFGHGTGMEFSAAGDLSALPALVLGGNCSFTVTGFPTGPVCHSARQGDTQLLPERLDQ